MALAKVLSQCVGPGGQLVANAVIVQQLLPTAGVRGLDVARVLFYHTAPTAEGAGAEPAAHGDQEHQRQHATHLRAAMQNSSSAGSLSRILGGSISSSSTGGMLLGWSTFTTTGMQQHYATMAAAADAGHTSSESESDADSDDKGGLLTAQQYRSKYSMWVHPPSAPAPCQTFEQAALPPQLLKGLLRHGFTAPTFIQAQAWPIAFEGRDLVAIASTGSGKTAGFLLPAFLHIKQQQALQQQQQGSSGMGQQQQQQQRGRGGRSWSKWNQPGAWGQMHPPVALVLAPTRELAQQTQHEAERLGGRDIITACLYGGASKVTQARALQRGPQLIIATPGRLLDFANSGEINLSRVSMLVLDEADRMLDMGFEPQIRDLMDFMPGGEYAMAPRPDELPVPPRQTLFFSATWPKEVQAIARQLCRNDPVQVFVGNVQDKLVANRDVTQLVAMLSRPDDRLPTVMDYLHEHLHGAERLNGAASFDSSRSSSSRDKHAAEHPSAVLDADVTHPRVVIFSETKRECDHLAVALSREGIKAAAVHGDKSQSDRDYSLRAFRQGRVPVLVATDVAARGLDIPGVTAVINYSFPRDHEMYIHRIGRTGRAGRKGESLTLLTPSDASVTPLLVDIMRDAGQEIPPELQAAAARVRRPAQNKSRYGSSGGSRGGRGGGYGGRSSSRGGSWGNRGGGGRQQWSGGRDEWAQGGGRRDTNSRSDSWNGGSRGGSRGGGRDSWGEVGSRKQRVADAWE